MQPTIANGKHIIPPVKRTSGKSKIKPTNRLEKVNSESSMEQSKIKAIEERTAIRKDTNEQHYNRVSG
jgi:hypothetical protein